MLPAHKLFDLTGKTALITGASRGIGEAIAKTLAAYGAKVILSSRKSDACEAVRQAIVREGGKAFVKACHIGDMDQIQQTFVDIQDEFGTLDILVNNAAANPFFGHILDTPQDAFEKTVDVNIRGYFYMSQEAACLMRSQQKAGVILNVASVNGVVPGPGQGIYSISKAAVISMTKAYAAECAPLGIRVNALLPGLTDTKFAGALVKDEKMLKRVLPKIPLNRVAQPNELVGAALYLVSDASSYTTGSCLTVDGGYLIC